VDRVRESVPEATIWIGSGLCPDHPLPPQADGAIVGTWLHRDSNLTAPIDPERVARMRELLG
jgi:predicted TIM-barrel enzyme